MKELVITSKHFNDLNRRINRSEDQTSLSNTYILKMYACICGRGSTRQCAVKGGQYKSHRPLWASSSTWALSNPENNHSICFLFSLLTPGGGGRCQELATIFKIYVFNNKNWGHHFFLYLQLPTPSLPLSNQGWCPVWDRKTKGIGRVQGRKSARRKFLPPPFTHLFFFSRSHSLLLFGRNSWSVRGLHIPPFPQDHLNTSIFLLFSLADAYIIEAYATQVEKEPTGNPKVYLWKTKSSLLNCLCTNTKVLFADLPVCERFCELSVVPFDSHYKKQFLHYIKKSCKF